ncbi:hypothetical protein Trydic_g17469 [Trypoxylus dichotomus]
MDSRLNWGAHINRVIDRGRQMAGTLAPLMNGRSKLDPARKIQLYKAVLRPTVTYASSNRMLRWALDAPWFVRSDTLHEDAGIDPIMDFIRNTATRFFDKARDPENPLVSKSQEYDARIPWKYPRPRSLIVASQD